MVCWCLDLWDVQDRNELLAVEGEVCDFCGMPGKGSPCPECERLASQAIAGCKVSERVLYERAGKSAPVDGRDLLHVTWQAFRLVRAR